ncbi:hypothetical protein [Mycobacterium marinum]|uniref:hypothetical protein n=1 Tax=Mycobacterium marinum TaxID=1781 RepID=UPI001922D8DE|nr:hypothetical protein [Mycobacterium marinum]QQW34000.1 hypothetical protein HXW97_09285 [Mycobacterium marinum]
MDILKVSDSELRSIQPSNIERLLANTGWNQYGGIPDVSRQWVYEHGNFTHSVVVPLDSRFDDYTIRLRELLKRISEVYPRQLESILLEIELPSSDELTNRKDSPSVAGSIVWKAGERQIVGFRKTLTASAKATEDRQRVFGRSHRKVAQDFMAQLRMGQTRAGSFIVTALSPTGPLPTTNKGGVYDEQLVGVTGRQVIETLEASLDTLRLATDEYLEHRNEAVFDETIGIGVSIDLLRGVRENLGTADAIETTITWNLELPRKSKSRTSRTIFEARHREGLAEAQSRLQKVVRSQKANVLGTVVTLDRDSPDEPGIITIRVLDGADANTVKLSLDREYNEAVESHKSGDLVRIRGTLNPGTTSWITDLDELALIDSRGYEHRLYGGAPGIEPPPEAQAITDESGEPEGGVVF